MSKKVDVDYLEDERRKLWAELTDQKGKIEEDRKNFDRLGKQLELLTEIVEKKTSDYEREARNASTQTTKYKNRAEDSAKLIDASADAIAGIIANADSIEGKLGLLDKHHEESSLHYQTARLAYSELQATQTKLASMTDEVATALEEAAEQLESSKEVVVKIGELKLSADSLTSKITTIHSQVAKRSQELNDLHDEVFGYIYKDTETGEETETLGLKVELETSYNQLKKSAADLDKELASLKNRKTEEFKDFEKIQSEEFEQIKGKIRGLLPQAMTAGLSHAYEEKRKSEENEGKAAAKTFWLSILLLLAISILPVIVSLYSFLHDSMKLDQIIHNLPQVVLAILPLYAPAFWFAISASKRIKLAKRLTEEYAHKEALSKTFEGLSTQIANLPDNKASRELKVKLLYNIISASSDNPGKLISDYNSSDNPILEVLDKSLSLSKSLEKISSIPGIGRILKKVEQSREEKLDIIEESVDENIPDSDLKQTA
jgi:hypothetical protein